VESLARNLNAFDQADDLVRLHLNENPYGASPAAVAAGRDAAVASHLYPDSDRTETIAAIAAKHRVPAESVIVGNGTDELLLIMTLALTRPRDRVVVTASTFPGYRMAADLARVKPVTVTTDTFRIDVARVVDAIERTAARVAFICNPHNPFGTLLTPSDIRDVVYAAARRGTVLIFDEAYMEYAGGKGAIDLSWVPTTDNVIVTRTFSKAYGLAAYRIGYAIGAMECVDHIRAVQRALPFSVNRPAQAAAIAAIGDEDHLSAVVTRNATARRSLGSELDKLGYPHVRSDTNFVLITGFEDSTATTRTLAAKYRILVRDAALFGCSGCLRVTIGTDEGIASLCEALAAESSVPSPRRPVRHGMG